MNFQTDLTRIIYEGDEYSNIRLSIKLTKNTIVSYTGSNLLIWDIPNKVHTRDIPYKMFMNCMIKFNETQIATGHCCYVYIYDIENRQTLFSFDLIMVEVHSLVKLNKNQVVYGNNLRVKDSIMNQRACRLNKLFPLSIFQKLIN